MRQRPGSGELERLANDILRAAPLPVDPSARSYEQRMALKALSIAGFDRQHGTADMDEEIELLAALYGEEALKRAGHDDEVRIRALNMVLVDQIRTGIWDETPPVLIDLLVKQVRTRLARVNPKYLAAREGEQS